MAADGVQVAGRNTSEGVGVERSTSTGMVGSGKGLNPMRGSEKMSQHADQLMVASSARPVSTLRRSRFCL